MKRDKLEKIIVEELIKEGLMDVLTKPSRWLKSGSGGYGKDFKDLDTAGETPVASWSNKRKAQNVKEFKLILNNNVLPEIRRILNSTDEMAKELKLGASLARSGEQSFTDFQATLSKFMDTYYPAKKYGRTGPVAMGTDAGEGGQETPPEEEAAPPEEEAAPVEEPAEPAPEEEAPVDAELDQARSEMLPATDPESDAPEEPQRTPLSQRVRQQRRSRARRGLEERESAFGGGAVGTAAPDEEEDAGGQKTELEDKVDAIMSRLAKVKSLFYEEYQGLQLFHMVKNPSETMDYVDNMFQRMHENAIQPLLDSIKKKIESGELKPETPVDEEPGEKPPERESEPSPDETPGGDPVPGEAGEEAGEPENAVPLRKFPQAKEEVTDPKTGEKKMKRIQPLSSKMAKDGIPKDVIKTVLRSIYNQLDAQGVPVTESLMTKVGIMLAEQQMILIEATKMRQRKKNCKNSGGTWDDDNKKCIPAGADAAAEKEAEPAAEKEAAPAAEPAAEKEAAPAAEEPAAEEPAAEEPSILDALQAKLKERDLDSDAGMKGAAEGDEQAYLGAYMYYKSLVKLQKALAKNPDAPADELIGLIKEDVKKGTIAEAFDRITTAFLTELLKEKRKGPSKARRARMKAAMDKDKAAGKGSVKKMGAGKFLAQRPDGEQKEFHQLSYNQDLKKAKAAAQNWINRAGEEAPKGESREEVLKWLDGMIAKFKQAGLTDGKRAVAAARAARGAKGPGGRMGGASSHGERPEDTQSAQAKADAAAQSKKRGPSWDKKGVEKGKIKISDLNQELSQMTDDSTRKKVMAMVKDHLGPYLKAHGIRLSEAEIKQFRQQLLEELQKRELLK